MSTTAEERTRHTPAGVIGDVLLWVASIGGVICILLVIAAVFLHITLIMFKTGSMEPTIPTGSLAVVHEIPASEIEVGQIVTVDRPGLLPITHRVTSVKGAGETRTITLRGDANPTDDAAPYVVNSVREVWTWVPGWASVVVWFSNPLVLGGLTLGATGLVTWAFWPRDAGHGRRRAPRRGGAPGSRGPAAIGTTGVTLLAAVAFVVGGTPEAAEAAEVETVVSSQYLELTSISDPDLLSSMTRLNPVFWQVGVDASPPEPGLVHLGVAATGVMVSPGDLSVRVQVCPVRWVAGVCSGVASTWVPTTDLATLIATPTAFGAHEIGSMNAAAQRWLMLTVTITATNPTPGDSAQLRLQGWGAGGPLSVSPGSLASTGPADGAVIPPVVLSLLAIGVGLLAAMIAARRRREVGHE
jgi:signal peptidase